MIQEDPNRVKFNESTKPSYFPTTASPLFPGYYRQFRGEYIIPFRGWNSLESLIPTCLHKGPIQPMHTLCTTYIYIAYHEGPCLDKNWRNVSMGGLDCWNRRETRKFSPICNQGASVGTKWGVQKKHREWNLTRL